MGPRHGIRPSSRSSVDSSNIKEKLHQEITSSSKSDPLMTQSHSYMTEIYDNNENFERLLRMEEQTFSFNQSNPNDEICDHEYVKIKGSGPGMRAGHSATVYGR